MKKARKCKHCGKRVPVRRGPMALYCSKACGKRVEVARAEERFRASLSKAERIEIGGDVAPILRAKSAKSQVRRITVVDKEGKAVRQTTDVEFAQSMLRRAGIEFSVEGPGVVFCEVCARGFKPVRPSQPSKRCDQCKRGRCAECKAPLRSAKTERNAKRRGREPLCRECSSRRLRGGDAKFVCPGCGARAHKPRKGLCRTCKPTPASTLCVSCKEAIKGYPRKGKCHRCYVRSRDPRPDSRGSCDSGGSRFLRARHAPTQNVSARNRKRSA